MRFAVLGTGMVGKAVGSGLVALGHEVRMGSRTADNAGALGWASEAGDAASVGDFASAAAFGEVVLNATLGLASLDALAAAGDENLAGKVLVDIANPLDFSGGFPPSVRQFDGASLAEAISAQYPAARVVKAMNTMNADLMLAPGRLGSPSVTFMAGDDDAAKATVRELLVSAGWADDRVLDLGGLTSARGMELFLPLWVSAMQALGTPAFNIDIVR